LLVGVAGRAADFLRRCFVRGTGHIRMAIDAGEHAAVDGIFETLRIDVQTDSLAVFVVGQRGVAVAGQAFIGGWFCWCFLGGSLPGGEDRSCRQQQGESNSRRKNSPYCSRGHTLTRQSL